MNNRLLAGNATFYVKNTITGNKFTFKIFKRNVYVKNFAIRNKKWKYFANSERSTKLGYISKEDVFIPTNGYKPIGKLSTNPYYKWPVEAFAWFWLRVNALPNNVEVKHANRCVRCGKVLTDESSMSKWFGPICYKKHQHVQ